MKRRQKKRRLKKSRPKKKASLKKVRPTPRRRETKAEKASRSRKSKRKATADAKTQEKIALARQTLRELGATPAQIEAALAKPATTKKFKPEPYKPLPEATEPEKRIAILSRKTRRKKGESKKAYDFRRRSRASRLGHARRTTHDDRPRKLRGITGKSSAGRRQIKALLSSRDPELLEFITAGRSRGLTYKELLSMIYSP